MLKEISALLSRLPRAVVVTIGFILVVILGVVDYATGKEISFSIFYLGPIIIVAWYAGPVPAIIIASIASVTWFYADVLAGNTYSYFLIPYWNAFMRLGFFIIIVFLLVKLKSMLDKEQNLSRTDLLTEVANSRYFNEIAAVEINRLKRYRHSFSVAYLDLDNFKQVNDLWGHSMGNVLLASAARAIKNNIRELDMVARIGGDEFIILMPETGADKVKTFMPRIKEVFDELMRRNKWPVTLSIGVATFTTAPANVDELISIVDQLMYSVKNSGKNDIKYEILKR